MTTLPPPHKPTPTPAEDLQAFMIVLRQALLMIVGWIERRYRLERHK